jgi:uncharacterized membrane protein
LARFFWKSIKNKQILGIFFSYFLTDLNRYKKIKKSLEIWNIEIYEIKRYWYLIVDSSISLFGLYLDKRVWRTWKRVINIIVGFYQAARSGLQEFLRKKSSGI